MKPRPRHRFAVAPDAVRAGQVRFPAPIARQMRRVLRLSPGDLVTAFDGSGAEYTVALTQIRDEAALGEIRAEAARAAEPRLRVTLCQALLPREKFELVLQKATEVGVARFIPLETERSLVKATAVDAGRLQRWRRIAEEAAEQSGRTALPEVAEPRRFADALPDLAESPALVAWERETTLSLREAFTTLAPRLPGAPLTILIGPEGGFTTGEVTAARAAGALTVSLGPRILRAETAGPILTALALYETGDLDPTH